MRQALQRRSRLLVGAALSALTLAACGANDDVLPGPPPLSTKLGLYELGDAKLVSQLNELKRATAKYLDVKKALDDGYLPTPLPPAQPNCADPPGPGLAGIFYVNPEQLMKPGFDRARPELLIYEAPKGDQRILAGIAFKTTTKQQPKRPRMFGVPFTGPTPSHGPFDSEHWDLHIWLWSTNRSKDRQGIFSLLGNTSIDCDKRFPRRHTIL